VPPYADCDGQPANGCEVNTSSETANCGACGNTCGAINGAPYCANSACQIDCAEGFEDCDDDRANGCEKNVGNDVNNCGVCGKICQAGNGTPWCVQGRCGVSTCPAGFGDCNGNPDDGCVPGGERKRGLRQLHLSSGVVQPRPRRLQRRHCPGLRRRLRDCHERGRQQLRSLQQRVHHRQCDAQV
jgi:hypothetical protein